MRGRLAGVAGPAAARQRRPGDFDHEIRALIRPSSNPSHLQQLLHVMETSSARKQDRHRPDLSRAGRAADRSAAW